MWSYDCCVIQKWTYDKQIYPLYHFIKIYIPEIQFSIYKIEKKFIIEVCTLKLIFYTAFHKIVILNFQRWLASFFDNVWIIAECNDGMYGDRCKNQCGHCSNMSQCHHVNGTCLTGCQPGYTNGFCKERTFVLFNHFIEMQYLDH